jgi:Ca2+:H+ antiporter
MGHSTEHLAGHYGPAIGGLLNASFGNAAELIIAILALQRGLHEVVKASLTGSIIGNALLVLGLSLLLGGFRHPRQLFNATAAGLGATLLTLSAIGLLVPAVFYHVVKATHPAAVDGIEQQLSLAIAVVLFVAYVLSLLFQLRTHRHVFAGAEHDTDDAHVGALWSKRLSLGVLVAATVGVAIVAELLVGSVEETADAWGMSHVFVGVILVAIVGNAAEHSTAVLMALKNKMDLAMTIALGSSIQIALFVAPMLVFASYAIGPGPMDLHFSLLEVVAVGMCVIIVNGVAHDGQSHWMEGILLLAVYVIIALAFYYLPVEAVPS